MERKIEALEESIQTKRRLQGFNGFQSSLVTLLDPRLATDLLPWQRANRSRGICAPPNTHQSSCCTRAFRIAVLQFARSDRQLSPFRKNTYSLVFTGEILLAPFIDYLHSYFRVSYWLRDYGVCSKAQTHSFPCRRYSLKGRNDRR